MLISNDEGFLSINSRFTLVLSYTVHCTQENMKTMQQRILGGHTYRSDHTAHGQHRQVAIPMTPSINPIWSVSGSHKLLKLLIYHTLLFSKFVWLGVTAVTPKS